MVTDECAPIVVDIDPLIEDLVSEYLVNRARDIEEIRAAAERGDFETIHVIGHNLQGSGGSYGFDEISVVGGELQRAAGAADTGEIARLLLRLEDYLSRVTPRTGPAVASGPGGAGRRPAAGEVQILVVDDQEMNAAIISRDLAREGFAVKHLTSGDDALALLEQGRLPALILLDVLMPGTNGFEVCRRIKANPATHFIPVMLVTSLDGGNDRLRGWAAGADDIVTKPVRREELVTRIRSLVRSLVPAAGEGRRTPENGAAQRSG